MNKIKSASSKTISFLALVFILVSLLCSPVWVKAQIGGKASVTDASEIMKLKKAVENDLLNPKAHADYIKAVGAGSQLLKTQYEEWSAKHPSSIEIPLAYATALYSAELPQAKPWLLKVVDMNPKHAKSWQMLWIDAERWGDFAGGREYLRKATEADPSSPDHAFYYASSFEHADSVKHHDLMLSMPDRYPGTERGAQALYWLANRSESPATKVLVYEKLKSLYNPAKSSWASGALSQYYDFLLHNNLSKARDLSNYMLSLGDSMNGRSGWVQRMEIADAIITARLLMNSGENSEALKKLHTVSPIRFFSYQRVALPRKGKSCFSIWKTQRSLRQPFKLLCGRTYR